MRIIAGQFRGRRILAPKTLHTRPTSDRVREALFSILGPKLVDAHVADLFAGSGALGLEALSRGARHCDFYENARPALKILRANIQTLSLTPQSTLIPAPLPASIQPGPPYDLVFIDPPWRTDLELPTLHALHHQQRLDAHSTLVLENPTQNPSPALRSLPPSFQLFDERRYGDTSLYFLRLQPPHP